MRHNKGFNHLGRQSGHRKAMLANMATSLIMQKRIETTLAKAKALREYVEPLITKSKDDSTHSRRMVFSYLKQKEAVTELFRVVAPKIADRPGGYTRIIKTGFRAGDAADTAIIEFVDFNEAALGIVKKDEKKVTTRRSRSKKATAEAEGTVTPEAPEVVAAAQATEGEAAVEEAAPKAAPKAAAKKAPAKPKAANLTPKAPKISSRAAAPKKAAPRKTQGK